MAVLGENLDPFYRFYFLLYSHFRISEEEKEGKPQDKEYEFRSLSCLGDVAPSASQPLVAAEVVEDFVEGTEETSVVEGEVVELQETDQLLSVQTMRHNSRTNSRVYDNATKLMRNLAFVASPMAQNERAGWSTCIQSVTRRLYSLLLLIHTLR